MHAYDESMPARALSDKGRARREAILATAMRELAVNGYGGTSVRAIGRAMGLEPAHILYYFGTREALLEAVIDRWDARANADSQGSTAPARALDSYAATIRRNLEIPGVIHLYLAFAAEAAEPSHRSHVFFRERFSRVHAMLADAIALEQSEGAIAAEIDAAAQARELIALADGTQLQALMDPRVDAPAAVERAIRRLRATGSC